MESSKGEQHIIGLLLVFNDFSKTQHKNLKKMAQLFQVQVVIRFRPRYS